jgi:protein disulfide-isomerase
VNWKSFLLDPDMPEEPAGSYEEYLMKRKGLGLEQVRGMLKNVTLMAEQAGLEYHFDRSVMVTSRKAHQLIQLAKVHGKDNEVEERLFKAYFTDGENIADTVTLTKIGVEAGLNETEVASSFDNQQLAFELNRDIQEARNIGVNGVPFFVFNRKYAISGAQPVPVFLDTLQKSFAEWRQQHPESVLQVQEGQKCSVDGVCE